MKFTITVSQKDINKSRADIIKRANKTVKVKGFRAGKAPDNLVEDQLDENKIVEEIIRTTVPPVYQKYIIKSKLKPISNPKITPKDISPNKEWTFDVEIAEKPTVTLTGYKQAVKKAKPSPKIWKPGEKPNQQDQKSEEDKKLKAIFDALANKCKVKIPPLLIEEEVNHALSNLITQIQKLGLSLEQYLSSMGKNSTQLREEYDSKAEHNLKIDFIIDAIGRQEKLLATDKDLKNFLSDVKDQKAVDAIEKSTYQQSMVLNAITRDRVINHLKDL